MSGGVRQNLCDEVWVARVMLVNHDKCELLQLLCDATKFITPTSALSMLLGLPSYVRLLDGAMRDHPCHVLQRMSDGGNIACVLTLRRVERCVSRGWPHGKGSRSVPLSLAWNGMLGLVARDGRRSFGEPLTVCRTKLAQRAPES